MVTAADQKTYWGLLETVRWICTRDEERVAAMWDMSEDKRIALAMFGVKAELNPYSLLVYPTANPGADRETAAPRKHQGSLVDDSNMMVPGQAVEDLSRKVHSRRVQMTAIRCHRSGDEQVPVPLAELNDLEYRIVPDHPVAPVGLWSRSRDTLVWRSPQFLRADVVRVWPARNTKTAAVSAAILHHLRQIMIPERPLTRPEAQRRCLAEVSNGLPWSIQQGVGRARIVL